MSIMNEEENTKLEKLIELLYTDRLSQYGKRELVNYIKKQQKEIEEKRIIIFAGAEKVKQLEKKIEKLKDKCKELIIEKQQLTSALLDSTPNDKIRELIKKYRILNNGQIEGLYDKEILALQELLEEK